MTAVAVRKHMDRDEPMMVASGDSSGRVGLRRDLSAHVAQHFPQANSNGDPMHPDVFIGPTSFPAHFHVRLNMRSCTLWMKRSSGESPRRRANSHCVASRMFASSYSL